MSAQSVTSWQSGFPPRTSFAPTPPPEALAVPTVILGLEAPRLPRSPEGSCLARQTSLRSVGSAFATATATSLAFPAFSFLGEARENPAWMNVIGSCAHTAATGA